MQSNNDSGSRRKVRPRPPEAPIRTALVLILLLCLFPLPSFARLKRLNKPAWFALTHVTIIDATGAPARPDMTVVIARGRISRIGPSQRVHPPKGARIIDATGKFLIPGLWDMHVHIDGEAFDRNANLALFIANGVTGVRIMDGLPAHHRWRREIAGGTLLGPRMAIASRLIDGPPSSPSNVVVVHNPAEALAAVSRARKEGADFIKVHDNVPRAAYFALMKEARRLRLPVEGHVPLAVTAEEAAAAGQKSIEHFTGLTEAESDAGRADAIIAVLKKHHTWHCPTLIMRNSYAVLDDARLANDWRLKYAEPSRRAYWLRMVKESARAPSDEWPKRREIVRKEKVLVGKMQRAGVGLLAGTDDANPFCYPGFSLHDELAMLVESGLTPMQALQAATLNPAAFFDQLGSLGTVTTGKFADLVLLDANPLEDIHNTTRISAVIRNGGWLDRKDLDRLLAEVESSARQK